MDLMTAPVIKSTTWICPSLPPRTRWSSFMVMHNTSCAGKLQIRNFVLMDQMRHTLLDNVTKSTIISNHRYKVTIADCQVLLPSKKICFDEHGALICPVDCQLLLFFPLLLCPFSLIFSNPRHSYLPRPRNHSHHHGLGTKVQQLDRPHGRLDHALAGVALRVPDSDLAKHVATEQHALLYPQPHDPALVVFQRQQRLDFALAPVSVRDDP